VLRAQQQVAKVYIGAFLEASFEIIVLSISVVLLIRRKGKEMASGVDYFDTVWRFLTVSFGADYEEEFWSQKTIQGGAIEPITYRCGERWIDHGYGRREVERFILLELRRIEWRVDTLWKAGAKPNSSRFNFGGELSRFRLDSTSFKSRLYFCIGFFFSGTTEAGFNPKSWGKWKIHNVNELTNCE